jgi:hypothetical protein
MRMLYHTGYSSWEGFRVNFAFPGRSVFGLTMFCVLSFDRYVGL